MEKQAAARPHPLSRFTEKTDSPQPRNLPFATQTRQERVMRFFNKYRRVRRKKFAEAQNKNDANFMLFLQNLFFTCNDRNR